MSGMRSESGIKQEEGRTDESRQEARGWSPSGRELVLQQIEGRRRGKHTRAGQFDEERGRRRSRASR